MAVSVLQAATYQWDGPEKRVQNMICLRGGWEEVSRRERRYQRRHFDTVCLSIHCVIFIGI
jgi:hypothetical protein